MTTNEATNGEVPEHGGAAVHGATTNDSTQSNDASQSKRRKTGLTLAISGVVVGVGLLVLLGPAVRMTLTNVLDRLNFSRHTMAEMDIWALLSAAETYALDHAGEYPESIEALITPDSEGRRYIKNQLTVPEDSWGRPYVYFPSVSGRLPRIVSYGRDRKPGGEGEDADIDSATLDNDG